MRGAQSRFDPGAWESQNWERFLRRCTVAASLWKNVLHNGLGFRVSTIARQNEMYVCNDPSICIGECCGGHFSRRAGTTPW
jgi:hypothetical protein